MADRTSDTSSAGDKPVAPIRELPRDELRAYADLLGIELREGTDDAQLIAAVEDRLKLIESLPREQMLEAVVWARQPVKKSATKIDLVREILQIKRVRFAGLSTEALRAMALIHGCDVEPDDGRDQLRRKLKRREGFWHKFRRKRRALFGKMIAKMVGDGHSDEYRFLPEERRPLSLKERIEDEGVVSGLTGRLRGAADTYVKEKLDEIEARIDRKLEEIDRRLAEWRDREIINRMRIIKITLFASVVVALLSLAYVYVKANFLTWLP